MHPGGPFWKNKDNAWSIPKGEISHSEDPEGADAESFAEELGPAASIGPLRPLGEIRQRGGKRVIAFAGEADFDVASLHSNAFELEWPPKSGRLPIVPGSRSRHVARSSERSIENSVGPGRTVGSSRNRVVGHLGRRQSRISSSPTIPPRRDAASGALAFDHAAPVPRSAAERTLSSSCGPKSV